MAFETHYSLRSLIGAGKNRSAHKKVFSFDLFDTLLIRRIHDPDLVKLPVARYISRLAARARISVGWQSVQRQRDQIEAAHRARTGQQFDDHEACYPRFMGELLEQLFGDSYSPGLLGEVTDFELKMENSMLVPRLELVEWLETLWTAGKEIYIISDMYLPATHLEKLVEHAGLSGYVTAVVSSADTFLAKASGRAFSHVAKKFGIDPQSWVHIGDNPISDGLRAAEFGIESLIIRDPAEEQRRSIVKRYYNYSDGKPFWRGRLLQQLMAPHEKENSRRSPLYVEGYNFIGPLIGLFVQRVAELCLENDIKKIFFLSREGWTFKNYWEKAVPILYAGKKVPDIEYLYVSRMALAPAACAVQGLTKTNASIAFLPPGNRDFRDLCRIFGLEAEKFSGILAKHGIGEDTCLSHIHDGYDPQNRKRFETMLEDAEFQGEVKRQTRDSNLALQRYLEDIGFFHHDKVAVVDIGWLGSIQRFLFEAVSHREDIPQCFGYLFGATRGIPYPVEEKNRIAGVVYDRDRFDLAASTLFYARDIFEEACRAPHPTLNGYECDGDGYKLVFRKTDDEIGRAELEQDSYFAPLQQGIIDSAERFGAAAALLGYEFADYKPWINSVLVNKLAFPAAREVAQIRHQHHLDDFHGQKKPKADFAKGFTPLWDRSQLQLKFDPFIRARAFFRHLRERINE
ncbi:HAD family hydrolase [Desulforhopalus singaporensis]|uniref:Haloacid dehalogenase-like hydrolase n=1 Tax=Desulforhopalus singaporensis TaxID=91360 RepID=A0A1H0PZR3_9BACT|nr:HAD family hydrolase [Desulforhopalus singaporensis]SDP09869.1 Haloacid dehalogenase-like hydrolase [Desulforhopalus singaporensis]